MSALERTSSSYLVRSRTNYQLKHFVIGQHDTPEMRYRQIIIEAKQLLHAIESAKLSLRIMEEKINKLKSSSSKIKNLKAKQHELDAMVLRDAIASSQQELDFLAVLASDYPHYTPEDIERDQEEYWQLRLTRQATTDRLALEQGINSGNMASMMQAGLVQQALTQ